MRSVLDMRGGIRRLIGIQAPIVFGVSMALAGCGDAKTASYVDPNPDAIFAGIGGGTDNQALAEHGTDTLERAAAIARLRGNLAAARVLHADDPRAATDLVALTIDTALREFEPRLALLDPKTRLQLRAAMERLRDHPPADDAAYATAVATISTTLVDRATAAVVPATASQDPGFRALVLSDQVLDAGYRYEQATQGESSIELPDPYREAYGLLLDARTRGLDALPGGTRRTVQLRLSRISDRWLPAPTPSGGPASASQVLDGLAGISDLIAASQGVDPTPPIPDPNTPDQLRLLQRAAAAAVQAAETGDNERALTGLSTAYRTHLVSAAPGLATIDPDQLATIEGLVGIRLPEAIATIGTASGGDIQSRATELDTAIDDAISLVESELELQRDAASEG